MRARSEIIAICAAAALMTAATTRAQTATLDPAQRLGDAGVVAGKQVFKISTYMMPQGWDTTKRTEEINVTMLRFMDSLAPMSPGDTSQVINFFGGPDEEVVKPPATPPAPDAPPPPPPPPLTGILPNPVPFPGVPLYSDFFGMRAEGYVVFSKAGPLQLGIDSGNGTGDRSFAILHIGEQPIANSGWQGFNQTFTLEVQAPGVYPIRIDYLEITDRARIQFYEKLPGGDAVAVNSDKSTIKVYESVTGQPYAWQPYGLPIEAARKVANVGDGGTLGWNVVAAKAPKGWRMENQFGRGTALIENDLVGLGVNFVPQATDTTEILNYSDVGEFEDGPPDSRGTFLFQSRFLKDRKFSVFAPVLNATGGTDLFAASATGYVEFPTAGDYSLGLITDDGETMWIGGKIVSSWPYEAGTISQPNDWQPASIHVDEAGIYDIRVQMYEDGGQSFIEAFQYMPDRTVELLNSPASTVKVYRDIKVPPAVTRYHNPVRLPLSAKVADIDCGLTSGFKISTVIGAYLHGDWTHGIGHEDTFSILQLRELLRVALDGAPTLKQQGMLTSEEIRQVIDLNRSNWPAGMPPDGSGARVVGYLALTAGGHIFQIVIDDGYDLEIGGQNVASLQSGTHPGQFQQFYVWAPEDGLYPFTLIHYQLYGDILLKWDELICRLLPGVGAARFDAVPVNTGAAAKAFVDYTPVDKLTTELFADLFGAAKTPDKPIQFTAPEGPAAREAFFQGLAHIGETAKLGTVAIAANTKLLAMRKVKVTPAAGGQPLSADFGQGACDQNDLALFWRAQRLIADNQLFEAGGILESLTRDSTPAPLRAQAFYDLARVRMNQHRPAHAKTAIEECAKLVPTGEPVRKLRFDIESTLLASKKRHELYVSLGQQRKIADESADAEDAAKALLAVGDAETKLGEYRRAAAALEEILFKYPECEQVPAALKGLIALYDGPLGDRDKARTYRSQLPDTPPATLATQPVNEPKKSN